MRQIMSRVVCPKCGNTDVSWIRDDTACVQYICLECKQVFYYTPKCDLYHYAPQTIFHNITASLETLAEKLVYKIIKWHSTIIGDESFRTQSEAIAATIEKLKEAKK